MPDTPRPPADGDDSDFKEWLRSRQPDDSEPISPSVAFMAMMRQAAERSQRSQRAQDLERALHPASTDDLPPIEVPYIPPSPSAEMGSAAPGDVPDSRPRRRLRRPSYGDETGNLPAAITPAPDEAAPYPSAMPTGQAAGIGASADADRVSTETQQLIDELEASQSVEESAPPAPRTAAPPAAPRKRSEGRRRAVRRTVGVFGGLMRSLIIVAAAAGLTATIFTWWTPSGFIPGSVREDLSVAIATSDAASAAVLGVPTPVVTPNYARVVGVVSGHRGPQNDPGAVCPDGLTEASINFAVAERVVDSLRARGYSVDLLDEFDPRLDNYQGAALVSIHANTCRDFGEIVSGYLIAGPAARVTARGNDQLLVDCISRFYGAASGLQRRDGVTLDMTHYHNFREIHPLTPGAIIELGFMLADRAVLTERQDALAQGITDGILCFIEPALMATQVPLIVPLTTPTPVSEGT